MEQSVRVDIRRHGALETDSVVIEEPLEIRVGDRALSVTLRTPGDDIELATGFVITESVVKSAEDIREVRHWGSPNVVRVALSDDVQIDWQRLQRHFYSTSSCGVCGKTSIDALRVSTKPLESNVRIEPRVIAQLPEMLRAQQRTFDATGGIHAAGAFKASGELIAIREDVGRHNAVDKVVGATINEPVDVLVLSGRAGFELVQKAIVARIPIVVAVGAPSSLAVELAREMHLTLLGFVRDGRYNVYADQCRNVDDASQSFSG
ncbi:MAG TPA: formate dehydrogenase accessory sulfurtransferase FdhD [Thermoanaerobaculia bacterium]|nr:formate dehydrogenase accessory sulfurtransferase FdhD [Thermoanaerobaculia bacterium]